MAKDMNAKFASAVLPSTSRPSASTVRTGAIGRHGCLCLIAFNCSCVRGSAEAVAKGLSCAVLCYGQTGSGKTHTMLGTAEDPGIILRSGVQLLEMLAGEPEGQLRVSFLEVSGQQREGDRRAA